MTKLFHFSNFVKSSRKSRFFVSNQNDSKIVLLTCLVASTIGMIELRSAHAAPPTDCAVLSLNPNDPTIQKLAIGNTELNQQQREFVTQKFLDRVTDRLEKLG
jgi:hypothetical protein